jgi:hypothetical protein
MSVPYDPKMACPTRVRVGVPSVLWLSTRTCVCGFSGAIRVMLLKE